MFNWKSAVAVVAAVIGAVAGVLVGDQTLSDIDFAGGLAILAAILGSGVVVAVVSKWQAGKAIAAALGVAVTSLTAAIATDSIVTTQEWLSAVAVALGAFVAVYSVPADDPADPAVP